MEFVKGNRLNYRLFKIVLNVIVIILAGYVFCDVTYMQLKNLYYRNNGIKTIAQTYKENNQIILSYAVDGEMYLHDISDENSPKEQEEIYYLKQEPDKFYRVAYKETIAYGYLFIFVLLILRLIVLIIAKYVPSYKFCGKRFTFEKEIISFRKK